MKNLKILRQQQGISQEKLAEQFHTSQQAIYKYEAGISQPDIQRLIEFSDYFHTSVDYLIGHTDDPRPCQDFIPTDLSSEELSFIEIYRILPRDVQSNFKSLMMAYYSLLHKKTTDKEEM